MAFDVRKLSGMMGGSVFSPSMYSYTTPDGVADVTVNGYWDELGGTLNIGDIILAVLLDEDLGTTVYKTLVVNLSTLVDSKTALLEVFVGDSRATDEAGYQSKNFSGNLGAGSESRMFTYRNNTDALAEIAVEGYFNELYPVLLVGDTVIVVANDGASFVRVSDITDDVVSTTVITFAP